MRVVVIFLLASVLLFAYNYYSNSFFLIKDTFIVTSHGDTHRYFREDAPGVG